MHTIQFTRKIGIIATKEDPDFQKSENLDLGLLEHERITYGPPEEFITKVSPLKQSSKEDLLAFIDYIINVYHQYIRENAIIIQKLAQDVLYTHTQNHPELVKLAPAIFLFLHDILNHMMREEEILFANTKQLIQRNEEAGNILYTTFGLIKDSVRLMQEDHKSAQESLIIFRELTNDYNLPENACGSYQHLFAKLKEFERNYLLHIRIENEILFPKALAVDGEIDEVKTNFGMMI